MLNFNEIGTKTARTVHIRRMLGTNPNWAIRGMLRIFANQTADEQASETTRDSNGIGFNGADAEILSSIAKQVNAGRTMSPKQMNIIFRKMPKYARQLESVSQ